MPASRADPFFCFIASVLLVSRTESEPQPAATSASREDGDRCNDLEHASLAQITSTSHAHQPHFIQGGER
jgi:hypothetical protein